MNVIKELYVLPDNAEYILYAPLKRILLTVNPSAVALLKAIRHGTPIPTGDGIPRAVDLLKSIGIIDSDESYPRSRNPGGSFQPTSATFLPTSDCNLRCIYCYANSGATSYYLSPEVALAAVDFICNNAKDKNETQVQVGFLGGGEPFLAWDLVQEIVAYTRVTAAGLGLSTYFTGVTNGMLSTDQVDWITKNFQYLNISMDGGKATQDHHRPTRDGQGSFDTVMRTATCLRAAGFRYAIRSTISSRSVGQMVPIVEFFLRELGASKVQLEPLFACGRCRTTSRLAPDPQVFVDNFKKCLEVVRGTSTELHCSAIRLDSLSATFCGALAENFYVTPEGYVTSCTEVSLSSEPLSSTFFIGQYDRTEQKFVFWDEKRAFLASRNLSNLKDCGACIAKWHCAGGCPVKAGHQGNIFEPTKLANCTIARQLTEHSIRTAVHGSANLPNISIRTVEKT
jgi:uncharacterized protein